MTFIFILSGNCINTETQISHSWCATRKCFRLKLLIDTPEKVKPHKWARQIWLPAQYESHIFNSQVTLVTGEETALLHYHSEISDALTLKLMTCDNIMQSVTAAAKQQQNHSQKYT